MGSDFGQVDARSDAKPGGAADTIELAARLQAEAAPTGCCIHALAARIQAAEKDVVPI